MGSGGPSVLSEAERPGGTPHFWHAACLPGGPKRVYPNEKQRQ